MREIWMVLCAVLLSVPAAWAQEVEPNDSMNMADNIGGYAINGYMAHGGDVDWFVLNGQQGVNPTFFIYHDTYCDFDFEVFSNGASCGRAIRVNSGDGIRCYVPGRCHIRVWACRGVGPYSIRIQP